jgi:hypothetical protein
MLAGLDSPNRLPLSQYELSGNAGAGNNPGALQRPRTFAGVLFVTPS